MPNGFTDHIRTTTPDKITRSELQSSKKAFVKGVGDAKDALAKSYKQLAKAEHNIKLYEGKVVPDNFKIDWDNAARQFNNDTKRLAYSQRKLGASVENMLKSFAETLGADTSKWTSAKINGSAADAWQRAAKIEGGLVERVISKPFRMAANHSGLALGIGGILAVIGIGDAMHKSAEKNTQDDALRQAAMIEAQMRNAPLAQANTVVMPQQAVAESSFPAAGTPMNAAPSQIMAGNDNLQHMGTMAPQQQQLASL